MLSGRLDSESIWYYGPCPKIAADIKPVRDHQTCRLSVFLLNKASAAKEPREDPPAGLQPGGRVSWM